MNRIATAEARFRSDVFKEAAARLRMPTAIVEKDFWVCWMLGLIFGSPFGPDSFVFKGGTALSKVYEVIQRFSEDIDLSLAPAVLGISEDEAAALTSRGKRDRWMKDLEARCCEWVKNELQPRLEHQIASVLASRAHAASWLEYEVDDSTQSPVLYFHYPCQFGEGTAYIRRVVKLEFGSLTDQRPTGIHQVRPWLAKTLPEPMQDMGCQVVALDVARAFWEKATILHAEHHRDLASAMPPRYSRHYADLAELARSAHASTAVGNEPLRQRVVAWKERFFPRQWARYDLAFPGTFRLLPPEERLAELERDFDEMREMFTGIPPTWDAILETLRTLEQQINA